MHSLIIEIIICIKIAGQGISYTKSLGEGQMLEVKFIKTTTKNNKPFWNLKIPTTNYVLKLLI